MNIDFVRKRRQVLILKEFSQGGLDQNEEKELATLEQQIDDYEYERDAEYNNSVDSLIQETRVKVKKVLDSLSVVDDLSQKGGKR